MTYSQPMGYRLPSAVSLTSVSRALDRFGWPVWRGEVIRALASVTAELVEAGTDREGVFRRLSNGQVGDADLVLSGHGSRSLLLRAAEFLDVAHAMMSRPSAIPLPSRLDLRCRAQFMDDPGDPERSWTYALFGTEHDRLEQVFLQLRGAERYPMAVADEAPADYEADDGWAERVVVWERVLEPFSRSTPLQISAPEPQILFDLIESARVAGHDEELAAGGKVTVTAAVAEVATRLGEDAPADLRERLLAPIGD